MRIRSMVAGLAAAAALVAPLSACSSATPAHVSVTKFASDISTPNMVLLDVRTPAEFAAGHIAGAINIDVEASDFGDRISKLDESAHYAVYCRSGSRSAIAVQKMSSDGFKHVEDLSGGLLAWAAAGEPITQ